MEIRNPQNLGKHHVVTGHHGTFMVLAWKDKKIVKAITTKHDNSLITVTVTWNNMALMHRFRSSFFTIQ